MAFEPEASRESPSQRSGEIVVGSANETVAIYQLAARWAERYSRPGEDLEALLQRFRRAYEYLDAVVNDLEPPAP